MRMRFPFLVLLYFAFGTSVHAATLADSIRQDLESPRRVTEVSGETLHLPSALKDFYTARNDTPGWVTDAELRPAVQSMLDAIRRSRDDGLLPSDYHLHALNSLLDALYATDMSEDSRLERQAALELLLSDAFLLLGSHESGGRAGPNGMDPQINPAARSQDMLSRLQSVMTGVNPAVLIQELAPQDAGYQAMRAQLAHYREIEAAGGFPEIPMGGNLRTGDSGPRVTALVARLEMEGDLPPDAASESTFGAEVAAAVRRFQSRHGLTDDGFVGANTLAALNQPVATLIDRLRINMERRRWLPQAMPATRVEVNIANYRATLYEKSQPLMATKVIVGQTARQTPEFSDRIRYLVINPAWDVPASIAGQELLPKVQADSGYLARHGYLVLQGWGAAERVVDPATVDWKMWTADTLPFHFRQAPGPENPLGQVKFMFPNGYDVYMHDTPSQELFDVADCSCTFSHGCIRIARALDFAAELLQLDGRPDAAAFLARAVAGGETRRVELTQPVPIFILYLTSWVDDSGTLQLRPDIYNRDPAVLRALDAPLNENSRP